MQEEASSRDGAPRLNGRLNLALFLFTGLLLLCLFDFYALPHNDWANFSGPARAFARAELPGELKVAPVYPLLIALASGMSASEAALLRGAQAISLLSGLVLLAALWALGRRYLPAWHPILLLLVAFNPCFLELSLQPLVETLLMALLGLAFLGLAQNRPGSACLAASAATLARMDAGPLLPLAMGARLLAPGSWTRRLVPSLLAGLAPAVWLGLGILRSRYGSPYVEEMAASSNLPGLVYLAPMLGRMLLCLPPTGDPLGPAELAGTLLLLGLAAIGAMKLLRQDRRAALVWLGFLGGYAAIHAVFKAANYRYNWPLQIWLVFLVVKAFEPADRPSQACRAFRTAAPLLFLGAGALLVVGPLYQTIPARWAWAFAALFTAAHFGLRTVSVRTLPVSAGCMGLVLLGVGSNLRIWEQSYREQKSRFSEHLAAARWLEEHAAPGERALMVEPWLIEPRLPGLANRRLIATDRFQSEDGPAYIQELLEASPDYVVWLSHYGDWQDCEYWQRRSKAYILNGLGLGEPASRPGFEYAASAAPAPGHRAHIFRFRPDQARRIGMLMDPRAEGLSRLLLREGWRYFFEGPPDDRFVWSTAPRSTIVLACPAPSAGAKLRFSASPGPDAEARPLEIEVSHEGAPLGRVLLAPGRNQYILPIPPERLRQGPNRFDFHFIYAGVPDPGSSSGAAESFNAQFFRIELAEGGAQPRPTSPRSP